MAIPSMARYGLLINRSTLLLLHVCTLDAVPPPVVCCVCSTSPPPPPALPVRPPPNRRTRVYVQVTLTRVQKRWVAKTTPLLGYMHMPTLEAAAGGELVASWQASHHREGGADQVRTLTRSPTLQPKPCGMGCR